MEFLDPGDRVKDGVALAMLEAAWREDKLKRDFSIFEPTSGNTDIGQAPVGRPMGGSCAVRQAEQMSAISARLCGGRGSVF